MSYMAMTMINIQKAKELANERNLKPGKVIGTSGVQFTSSARPNSRLEVIDWEEFERTLNNRGLAVFESNGWMKIMRRR